WPAGLAGLIAAGIGVSGGLGAVAMAVRARSLAGRGSWGTLAGGVFGLVSAGWWAYIAAAVVSWSTTGFARGRQLRERGQLRFATVGPGDAWAPARAPREAADPGALSVPDEVRAELAAAWRDNGRTEHASVAAFARTSLELIALGAPPELLADASRDALDEIRHTELCFGLARALDGQAASPGRFPEATTAGALSGGRTRRLIELAVVSLVDGALHEGLSARVIAKLVRRCELEPIREVLRELAADEGRHAAHGWDVVEWCLAEGGVPVAIALRTAVDALPASIDGPRPAAAIDGAWERYGIPGRALEQEQYALARAWLVDRVRARIAAVVAIAA
ncbi:MAG: ferritin-like domain-containing protein, partial [Myxococcota bacterium]